MPTNYVAKDAGSAAAVNANFTSSTDGDVTISDSGLASLGGKFTLDATSSVTVNSANGGTIAELNASDATTLSINADSGLTITTGILSAISDLQISSNSGSSASADKMVNIGGVIGGQAESINIELEGTGGITLANIGGSNTETVTVSAENAYGNVVIGDLTNAGTTTAPTTYITAGSVEYTGNLGKDVVCATLTGTGTTISTGAGEDTIDITLDGLTAAKASNPTAILSGGGNENDTFAIRTASASTAGFVQITDWNKGDELLCNTNVVNAGFNDSWLSTPANVNAVLGAFGLANLPQNAVAKQLASTTGFVISNAGDALNGTYITSWQDGQTSADCWMIQILGATEADLGTIGTI